MTSSYSFEFKTAAGKKPCSFHFSIHEVNTEKEARDILVAQLEDLISQANALEVSDVPRPNAQEDAPAEAPAEEDVEEEDEGGDELPAVDASMKPAALKAIAEKEGVELNGAKKAADIVAAIEAHRAGEEDVEEEDEGGD